MNSVQDYKSRNIGIDLLRMLAMFMIVVLHILNKGGVTGNTEILSVPYGASWLLEIFTLCAVNCFAIISGYVGVNVEYKYSNFVNLWLRVMFYTVIITVMFAVLRGGGTLNTWIKSIFPVCSNTYWYVTAYFGLFLFMPILNAAVRHFSEKQYRMIVVMVFVAFSCMQTLFHNDTFRLNYGFSIWWLIIMYLVGGYVKQYGMFRRMKKRWLILLYGSSTLLTWLYKLMIEYITLRYTGEAQGGGLLLDYTSPTIVLVALFLFLTFERMTFKSAALTKIILKCSPLAFSVYLIHLHPLIWNGIWENRFAAFLNYPIPIMLFLVFGTAIGIYGTCMVIDAFREWLFRTIKIKDKLKNAENKMLGDVWSS